ncbi:NAD-dependent protein deacetylase sirtuin-1 isoform X2 [Anabrus simplex]|uniref:NAD-dependent protein deacetylase sirtuin-1 isoform X2 n=1 Tax=Anabrus simplex TaxID=316456 RepID=UPI0035A286C6
MALVSGDPDYSSPSKRIKLDPTQHLSNSNVELDFGAFSAPLKNVHSVIEGEYSVSAEILNSGDSGFNEISSVSYHSNNNETGTSLLDSSTQRSPNSEDGRSVVGERDADEEDDKDEVSSTVSNLSNLSGLSDLSGQEWKPMAGPMSWVQKQMLTGVSPRTLLNQLMADGTHIPPQMDDITLWKIIVNILSEPPRRQKLRHINTLADVVRLLRSSKRVIVLTGAGVSVSCGIPDFRSRDGIYSRLAIDFPDLPDPQAMFDIQYFSQDPRPFFKFAREIYPGQFKPSPCHRFIKMLEKHGKLLRNYSQNIDTLEQVAGIKNVIECHGSFATASCTHCKYKVTADEIREDIFAQRIPLCPRCPDLSPPVSNDIDHNSDFKELVSRGIMKPDIVFFGEGLPEVFHDSMAKDKDECDLLIVIGSSLKVRPVALIPSSIPSHVPQILINREPLPHFNFDVKLLGDSDVIINQICNMLGDNWNEICWHPPLAEAKHLLPQVSSRRNSCDNSWKEHASRRTQSSQHIAGDCSSQDSISHVSQSASQLTETSADRRGDQVNHAEGSEAESLQMSIDSGLGGMLTDSSCSILKERHMSVDSSTRDSGICFSADSPTDNSSRNLNMIVDSSRDSIQTGLQDNHFESGVPGSSSNSINSSNRNHQYVTSVDSSSGKSLADSTSASRQQQSACVESSYFSFDSKQNCIDSSRPNSELESASADSSCNGARIGGISSSESNCCTVAHRHMSVDSMRDSGISDGSNSIGSSVMTKERHMSVDSSDDQPKCDDDLEMLRACWQPKVRESLASRLPVTTQFACAKHLQRGKMTFYWLATCILEEEFRLQFAMSVTQVINVLLVWPCWS